jgi:hypothetical protein
MIQATNAIVRRADNDTLSAQVELPAHIPRISVASDPSQRVINSAPQEMSLVVAKPNPQPPSRHRQTKSPTRSRRRSKSPLEKVAAAQKVRVVAQEDLRKEEEFALMQKHVSSLISDYRFLTDKHQVAWQSEVMKEIQAQLNDFKKRAENAEQVAQQAEGRAAEAEKHMRVERENAATMIAEACRQLRREVDERTAFENTHAMMLDDFERRLPAGQGTIQSNQQDYLGTPGPSAASVERGNAADDDMSEDPGGLPLNGTRTRPPPRVGYFSHSDPPY